MSAWQTRREANTGGNNETALPKEEVKADSIGDATLAVNNVGLTKDSREFEKKKKKKKKKKKSEAASSIGAVKSTSQTMVVADAKENLELVASTIVLKKSQTQVQELPELIRSQLTKARRVPP